MSSSIQNKERGAQKSKHERGRGGLACHLAFWTKKTGVFGAMVQEPFFEPFIQGASKKLPFVKIGRGKYYC